MKASRLALFFAVFLAALLSPPPSPLALAEEKGEEKKSEESAPQAKVAGEAGKKAGKPADARKAEASGKGAEGKKGGTSEKKEAPAGPRPLPEIEKDMKKARSGQNFLLLFKLVQEAMLLSEPEAYRAIVAYALRGEDRDLELKVFRLLIKLEDPAAAQVLWQEALRSQNFKTRIILLAVAFQKREDPKAFAVLLEALKDPSRPVALTAVRYLKEAKDADRAVPALIEAMKVAEKGPRGRLFFDIRDALRSLTGADREIAADWRTYWESAKSGKRPKPSGAPKTRVVLPNFFSIPVESDRVLFIIDISGSMLKRDPPIPEEDLSEQKKPGAQPGKTVVRRTKAQEGEGAKEPKEGAEDLPMDRERLFRVKRELTNLVRALPKNVTFTIMSFNHQTAFIGESPKLMMATEENKKRAEEWVRGMQANGETWTDTAFERALTEVTDVDTVYLLSDGAPFRSGKKIPEDKVREGIKDLNRFVKARIHTFGFVQEGMNLQRFLMAVAAENDGKYTALK